MADFGHLIVPYAKLFLTVDGGSNGIITLPSTVQLRIKSVVYLTATGLTSKQLVVDDIIDDFQVALRDPDIVGHLRFNCSAYTVALSAALVQPQQTNFFLEGDPGVGDIYRILRDIRRTGLDVNQGSPNTLGNAWPVKITDGLNVLGTTLNPLVVSGGGGGPALSVDVTDRANRDLGKVDVASLDQYIPIDVDTVGTLNALPITWRKESAGGAEFGTLADPVRVDPVGTTAQPTKPQQFTQAFSNIKIIQVTHNLNQYPFNIKVITEEDGPGGFGVGGFGEGGFGEGLGMPCFGLVPSITVCYTDSNEFIVNLPQNKTGVVIYWI